MGSHPAITRRWPNVGSMLGQRRRQWPNINPTLGQRLVSAGEASDDSMLSEDDKKLAFNNEDVGHATPWRCVWTSHGEETYGDERGHDPRDDVWYTWCVIQLSKSLQAMYHFKLLYTYTFFLVFLLNEGCDPWYSLWKFYQGSDNISLNQWTWWCRPIWLILFSLWQFLSSPVLYCPVLSYPVLSCSVLACSALPCPVWSCPVLPCLSCPCLVLPVSVLPCPCPSLSCPALPCPVPFLSFPSLPCPALPCPALPCPALPCPALPCPALLCSALPCPALLCPALPCPALSCPVLSCPALSCHIMPCPVMPALQLRW